MKNFFKYFILIIVFVLCIANSLFWLSAIITFFLLYNWVANLSKAHIKYSSIKLFYEAIINVFNVMFTLIVCLVLILDFYYIPSDSMTNTLHPQDFILVNKLSYGPTVPKTEKEIPFSIIFEFFGVELDNSIFTYFGNTKRLSGYTEIKRGDVVVFDFDATLVKRCVGIPGDTIKMVNAKVYINGVLKKDQEKIRNSFIVKLLNPTEFYQSFDSLKIESSLSRFNTDKNWFRADVTIEEVERLRSLSSIDSIKPYISKAPIKSNMFPWYKDKGWTLDNFGIILIPKKGMSVEINSDTYKLYEFILKKYENIHIRQIGNNYYFDDILVDKYIFKNDYYYMLGDYRKNSRDSRYIGFIPKQNIIGKVDCVLFSYNDDKFNWNRFLKDI